MKLKNTMSKLLTNKVVLYVVFALVLLNFIGYLMYGKMDLAIGILLIGGLTSFFTKNMTIIMLVPLVIISLLASSRRSVYEGMTADPNKNENHNDTMQNDNTNDSVASRGNASRLVKAAAAANGNKESNTKEKKNGQEEPFEAGRNKKQYDLDYASTVEDAYAELNNIIGSDGIQRLTSDTQNLMKQQLQLAEAMKSMGPLIENMKPIMESMGPLLSQANGFMNLGK